MLAHTARLSALKTLIEGSKIRPGGGALGNQTSETVRRKGQCATTRDGTQ